ncbi:divergent PAP2 family protein [Paenibacillus hubeiensis]|uniref:divergent PAP2 family protein n=1 Tax=Paenibacillus hubeiensis TaxID=3077330 RepID=UPI0031B9D182
MYYFLVPLIGWFIAGSMKFAINYFRFGADAKNKIGNGGFPSNHTTVVTSVTVAIGFNEGFHSPMFGLGVALIMIIIIDATGLRRYVGYQALSLNELQEKVKHRVSVGHNKLEVVGGLVVGTLVGFVASII